MDTKKLPEKQKPNPKGSVPRLVVRRSLRYAFVAWQILWIPPIIAARLVYAVFFGISHLSVKDAVNAFDW